MLRCMTQLIEAPVTDFERTTAVTPLDGRPGRFSVELDAGWSSLVGIHGGYLTAIAVRGAEAVSPDRTTSKG